MKLTEEEQKIYDDKVSKVMHEWKTNALKSNGKVIKNQKQAIAIAISEAMTAVEKHREKKKEKK